MSVKTNKMAKASKIDEEKLEKNERIFSILFEEDDVTWQNMIMELVKTEQMNPWDIDISLLAQKFLEKLRELQQTDFRISGKMILAAAILLKMKSDRLVGEDLVALDALINSSQQEILADELGNNVQYVDESERPKLYPRTPQPRKRRVSIYDLINALEKALVVEGRRPQYIIPDDVQIKIPERKTDITKMINTVYVKIQEHYTDKKKKQVVLTFEQLIPGNTKLDKTLTFIPLLHLDTLRKIDLMQEHHFGEIQITLAHRLEINEETPENKEESKEQTQ